jgi:hypothetical protein
MPYGPPAEQGEPEEQGRAQHPLQIDGVSIRSGGIDGIWLSVKGATAPSLQDKTEVVPP